MSENKPQPKDRTALYIAIVGATATIAAALIGVLPNLMNRSATPTPVPIVITTTPVPTLAALATSATQPTVMAATSTSEPPTALATAVLPTATIAIPAATATSVPATLPISTTVSLLVVNNLPQAMEFFVDNTSAAKINSGNFRPLKVMQGIHNLKQCILGSDYTVPSNCFNTDYDVEQNPDVWELFDANNPLVTNTDVNLLILNRANTKQDVFVDNQLQETVGPSDYIIVAVKPGPHNIQACATGFVPPNGACGQPVPSNYRAPTHYFFINGESS